jgi:hypothetical protein
MVKNLHKQASLFNGYIVTTGVADLDPHLIGTPDPHQSQKPEPDPQQSQKPEIGSAPKSKAGSCGGSQ